MILSIEYGKIVKHGKITIKKCDDKKKKITISAHKQVGTITSV